MKGTRNEQEGLLFIHLDVNLVASSIFIDHHSFPVQALLVLAASPRF